MNKFLLKSSAALMTALSAASSATFASWNMGPFGNGTNFVQTPAGQAPVQAFQPMQLPVQQEQPARQNYVPGQLYQGTYHDIISGHIVQWSFIDGKLTLNGNNSTLSILVTSDHQTQENIFGNMTTLTIGEGISGLLAEFFNAVPMAKRIYVEPRNSNLNFYTMTFDGDCILSWGPLNGNGLPENELTIRELDRFLDSQEFYINDETLITFDPNNNTFDVYEEGEGTAAYRYVNGQFITVRPFTALSDAMSEEE